jgi:hypothetical protein
VPLHRLMHILCEFPDKTTANRIYFFAALGIFVFLAVFFYAPWGTDWQVYGTADWDYSNFTHAVPVWTVKYFHEFPLWNPYVLGGFPLIGNPQSPSPFSLTFLLSLIAGPLAGIKLGNALNAVIGMTGMYVLMGYFNTIWIARILAAVVLALNGTVVYHVSQGHFMWMMTMYWPWMLFFFIKSLDNRLWVYPAALVLSLQFWGGAIYPFAFAISILGLLTVLFALRDKKAGHLLRFVEMVAAFIVFSGPRLFMVLETLYRFPRVIGNEDAQVPWSVFYYAFLCQDQIHNHVSNLKVDEFSAYVGIIPFVLVAVLFFQWKKFWPYLCVLLFSLGMALGNSPYSPFWPVFHLLGAGYSHFSTRSFLISVFFIAMGSGLSLSYLVLRWREKFPMAVLISCLGVIFVIFNLFSVLSPVRKFTVTNARQYEEFNPSIPFSQMEVTQQQEFRFANSSMMDRLLRNTGTANGYEALPIPSHVRSINSQGYRGEFYLQNGLGSLGLASWSPNKWDVKFQVPQKDVLVVNQNFDPGWSTDPPRKILNVGGIMGVEVTPEDSKIVFYYLPFNFILGCWVSVVGLMAMGWDSISKAGRKRQIFKAC